MPINKYHNRDLSKMRDMVSIDSAMFIPKLEYILGPDRLVKGEMLQCSYGMPAFAEMRGMHSTLAMAMALDSIKRYHNDTPIFHMPYEQMEFYPIDYTVEERLGLHRFDDISRIHNIPDFNPSNSIKERPYLYIDSLTCDDKYDRASGLSGRAGLFPDSEHWATSVCKYDENKIKAYTIPSKDRLEMLTRIYKLIKGNK